MEMKIQMVLHKGFGGFHITAKLHEELEARKVPWLGRCARTSDGRWYMPADADDEDLRRDPDLVAAVRELEIQLLEAHGKLGSWEARAELEQLLLHGLKVVDVTVEIEIEDNDGDESVRVTGGSW